MKIGIMKWKLVVLALLLVQVATAQQAKPAFWDEIQAFKKKDSVAPPPANPILFIGSSSFRLWSGLQAAFPGYTIVNRAFGGATIQDMIFYKEDILKPYKPRQIVMYCGENDFAASDSVSVETVVERFKMFYTYTRSLYPGIPFHYVSMKPSVARKRLMPKYQVANAAIAAYIQSQPNTGYLDVYSPMLLPDGNPRPDIFIQDNLHMNPKGYAIWIPIIKPILIKDK